MLFSLSQSLPLTKIGQIDGRFYVNEVLFLKAQKFGEKKFVETIWAPVLTLNLRFNVETVILKRKRNWRVGLLVWPLLHGNEVLGYFYYPPAQSDKASLEQY